MTPSQKTGIAHSATTPRAAAVAGIIFTLVFSLGIVLVRVSVNALDNGEFTADTQRQLTWSMALMPFAGIAFLWFLGVIRHQLGENEDKFFATVTLGSGLLFVAMSFVASAVAVGMMTAYGDGGSHDSYVFGRTVIDQVFNIYALKMAALFMSSLGTLWQKTEVMPRTLAWGTYILSFILLASVSRNLWLTLLFPAWVLVISIFILVTGLRRRGDTSDALVFQGDG